MNKLTISLSNEMQMIPVVMSAARTYAQALGFNEKECGPIELILEEALSNLIKYDFMPGQDEIIHLTLEHTALGIGLRFRLKGVPIDVEEIQHYEHRNPESMLEEEGAGLGIYLISRFADRVQYKNLGKEGQEVWIEKYLPDAHISQQETTATEDSQMPVDPVKCDFYIRRMKSAESPVISRLAYYAYNLSYIYDQIYYPERVKQLNASGEMISYIAANKANEEVVGHCALIKDELSAMFEMAVAFVNPVYRGSGCLKDLAAFQFEELKRQDCMGVFVHAVTTHPYSQKAAWGLGLRESALMISRVSGLIMNKISTENMLRESLLFQCHFLIEPQLPKVYCPPHHREIIREIFENICVTPDAFIEKVAGVEVASNKRSVIESKTDNYQAAQIFIKEYGEDALPETGRMLKAFCRNRIETIFLFLPLDSPETIAFCSEAENLGFFFAGVRPGANGRFWLLLQFLNNQQYDYSGLKFCSEFGNRLLHYVMQHDPAYDKN